MSVSATSALVERLFSTEALMMRPHRSRIRPHRPHRSRIGSDLLSALTTLKSNYDLKKKHYELQTFKSLQDSAVKDHILSCEKCSNNRSDENNFVIILKCKSEFCSKIHEALLIKKLSPKLNRQMFANGASYLLNIF